MSHDEDHSHIKTNPNAIKEDDKDLPYRIRSIDLVKHNPNLFNVQVTDVEADF